MEEGIIKMSLKEEIFNIIYLDDSEVQYLDTCRNKRDKIVAVIEKRIDEMESKYKDMEISMCADLVREELLK
jgi:hypothetical protein